MNKTKKIQSRMSKGIRLAPASLASSMIKENKSRTTANRLEIKPAKCPVSFTLTF